MPETIENRAQRMLSINSTTVRTQIAHEVARDALAMHKVLDVVALPFVTHHTYQDTPTERRPNPPIGHAFVLRGARVSVETWCHDPDAVEGNYIWHLDEEGALACFEEHHPGLRDAITTVTEALGA